MNTIIIVFIVIAAIALLIGISNDKGWETLFAILFIAAIGYRNRDKLMPKRHTPLTEWREKRTVTDSFPQLKTDIGQKGASRLLLTTDRQDENNAAAKKAVHTAKRKQSKKAKKKEPLYRVEECFVCQGRGQLACLTCGGTGLFRQSQIDFYTGNVYPMLVDCPICQGRKFYECYNCGGKGTVKVYINPTPQPVPVMPMPFVPSIDAGNSTRGSSVNTLICTFCNGTGKSPVRNYPPDYTGNSLPPEYCPICGALDTPHTHPRCESCLGKGHTIRSY